jgi:hypothetical protein
VPLILDGRGAVSEILPSHFHCIKPARVSKSRVSKIVRSSEKCFYAKI